MKKEFLPITGEIKVLIANLVRQREELRSKSGKTTSKQAKELQLIDKKINSMIDEIADKRVLI
jgi:hypothetical protein